MTTKIFDFIKENIFKIIVSILLLLLYVSIALIIYYLYTNKDNKEINNIEESIAMNTPIEEEPIIEYIYVDVKGSVKKPNVYRLEKGSRTIDAIKSAGGLSKNANTRFINLSKLLNDGDVVVIYSNDEIKKAQKTNTIYVETPCVCEEVKNDSCYNENTNNSSLININTASLDELLTLSGIGEAKAKAIIEYRQTNGNFSVIEDIIKVSGISETIFAKIKNYITV